MGEFERALAKVLVHEGGYVNHPKDPGGATNQGVTQAVYDDYRRNLGSKTQSVRSMSSAERDSIYRGRYWALIKGESLPPGVSYVVFDGAVNSGVSQSAKWLQRAVGAKADGVIGPATLLAVKNYPKHGELIDKICDLRLAFLKSLKTWPTFGKGWASRVAGVRQVGKAWAMEDAAPETAYVPEGNAKARPDDLKKAPTTGVADAATGGGIGAGAAAAALDQARDQLSPYATASQWIGNVVTVLVIVSALLAIGGIGYRWWASRRRAEIKAATS